MSLLQLSEPDQSPDPHQRRVAIGIDLGTTYSLVACMRHGVIECLPDSQGRPLLPSVVRYQEGGAIQVGFDAVAMQEADPHNTISSAKRYIGRSIEEIPNQGHLPYQITASNNLITFKTSQGDLSPVEVSAQILLELKKRAEQTLKAPIFGAVVTVPAYFDDGQRQATKDAARLAGLNVLRLINEPTAAAIAYGLDQGSEGVYAVYDLGGGTFDISILRLSRGVFEVLATGGDAQLGGDDWDHAVIQWLVASFELKNLNANDKTTLRLQAKQGKEALSITEQTRFDFELSGRQIVQGDFSRLQLQAITQSLADRTIGLLKGVLRDAKLGKEQVDGIILVGGSTRMPQIHQEVENFFGRAPLTNLNPDEVVALGAAAQANQLAGNNPEGDLLLLDVLPLSLGLETMGGLVERIISRNQTIPVSMAQTFTTYMDGQTAMSLHIVQGERDLVRDCRSLARFDLLGLPPLSAGAARVQVTFTVDADGLLSVEALEEHTGVAASIAIKPSYGLSDEQITHMLQESFAAAKEDLALRTLIESRVEAEHLLMASQSAIEKDGDLLLPTEKNVIESIMETLRRLVQTGQKEDIEQTTKELAAVTESFAAKRMNCNLAAALTGKNLSEI